MNFSNHFPFGISSRSDEGLQYTCGCTGCRTIGRRLEDNVKMDHRKKYYIYLNGS
jgi:hypothetical protein